MLELRLGDRLQLKKAHPCGSREWEVVRVGADIGIRCLKYHRRLLVERGVLERKVVRVQHLKNGAEG